MASDVDQLSDLMLKEFERVHERFDALEGRFSNLDSEVALIRRDIASLETRVGNISGYAKEIDHLLQRLVVIEKHLGLNKRVSA